MAYDEYEHYDQFAELFSQRRLDLLMELVDSLSDEERIEYANRALNYDFFGLIGSDTLQMVKLLMEMGGEPGQNLIKEIRRFRKQQQKVINDLYNRIDFEEDHRGIDDETDARINRIEQKIRRGIKTIENYDATIDLIKIFLTTHSFSKRRKTKKSMRKKSRKSAKKSKSRKSKTRKSIRKNRK